MNNNNNYNVDKAWEKVYNKLDNEGLIRKKDKKRLNIYQISGIAALFLISISLSLWNYNADKIKIQTVSTFKEKNIRTLKLSDGTIVDLNTQSQLKYPEKFNENKRIVELKGEAFFMVSKNSNKPFIIKAYDKEIQVLGTSFNVRTNKNNQQVEVFVKTGKVQLYQQDKKNNKIILEAGYKGIISSKEKRKKKITDPNYLAWKTKYFDFSYGERLDKIIEKLNKAYHVNIILKNSDLNSKIIYTTYNQHSLDTILQLIALVNNLQIEKKEEQIILH